MEKQNKTPHLQKWLVPPQNAIKGSKNCQIPVSRSYRLCLADF